MSLVTDCLLLREGPNGLFNCAHIVRSDKISYLPLQMTWNSCLKIAKHFRMAQFVMHFQLSMLSVLSEVACEGQQCTVHTVSQKEEETILHVLHWFLVGKQISDCSFSLQKDEAAYADTVFPLFWVCPISSWWWWNSSGMCPQVSTDQQNWKYFSSSPVHLHTLQFTHAVCNVGTLVTY